SPRPPRLPGPPPRAAPEAPQIRQPPVLWAAPGFEARAAARDRSGGGARVPPVGADERRLVRLPLRVPLHLVVVGGVVRVAGRRSGPQPALVVLLAPRGPALDPRAERDGARAAQRGGAARAEGGGGGGAGGAGRSLECGVGVRAGDGGRGGREAEEAPPLPPVVRVAAARGGCRQRGVLIARGQHRRRPSCGRVRLGALAGGRGGGGCGAGEGEAEGQRGRGAAAVRARRGGGELRDRHGGTHRGIDVGGRGRAV
ncbi:hypothetical protein DFJ74DRAFT_742085, partial [Hyaloraphidium curvatum]